MRLTLPIHWYPVFYGYRLQYQKVPDNNVPYLFGTVRYLRSLAPSLLLKKIYAKLI